MKKKKLVIIGAGIAGLLCSYVFRKRKEFEVRILECNEVGGEFLASGMRYVGAHEDEEKDHMIKILNELGLANTTYLVKGGIFLKNEIHSYPKGIRKFGKERIRRIEKDYYRKSRLVEPSKKMKNALNDPANNKKRKAIKFNSRDFIVELSRRARIIKERMYAVTSESIICSDGLKIPYDYLVLTIPLWDIKEAVYWDVPTCDAIKMNSAYIITDNQRFLKWDHVYTPYTPSNYVYKVISAGCGYVVECSGEFKEAFLHSDLEFLFDGEWKIQNKILGNKGYMISFPDKEIKWPRNVAPLGRFATWDPYTSVDVTLSKIERLSRRWGSVNA
jgi:hypothetical protein